MKIVLIAVLEEKDVKQSEFGKALRELREKYSKRLQTDKITLVAV